MHAVDVPVGRAAGPSDIQRPEGTTTFLARMTRSVAGKLFLVVFLVLLLNLGVLGYVNVKLHREQLESARLAAAERMTDVVQRSTSYYMLRNDREALSHTVSTLGEEPGISRLRILNEKGRVGFSTHTPEIGSLVRLPGSSTLAQQATILSGTDGRYLSITSPILNSPSCSTGACHFHPETEKVLGRLNLKLSLAEADADVRKGTLQFVGYSALAILVTLATIGVLVFYFVHGPVRSLRRGTERLGRGELGVQLPVRSDDELGDLAASFNEMSRQLHDAREESNAWAQCLEDRVRRKSAELKRAHDQMMQAEKLSSLGKLAAVVAHEINNPLSGILTYAKLLRRWIERGDPLESHKVDMRDSLQLIENESRRCGEIVRNLLTFARVQPMNLSDVDLNRIVRSTMKLVEHKLELGNITPRVVLGEELPPLRGDSGQIEQLLLALVMNAIEAMPREGNLHVSTSSRDSASVVIRIEDDGMGIPPDILPRLFEPFMTTKEEGKGVGLGLAISRAIVDRHGGRIDVQSEAGRGTAFTITIPCGTGAPAEPEASPRLTPHPEVA